MGVLCVKSWMMAMMFHFLVEEVELDGMIP